MDAASAPTATVPAVFSPRSECATAVAAATDGRLVRRGAPEGAEPKPLSDSSRKAHLAVLRSFFAHRAARFGGANPAAALNDVRFRRRAPKRTHLTEREAGRLLAAAEREA